MRARAAWVLCAWGLSACFEAGPLGARLDGGLELPEVKADAAAEVAAPDLPVVTELPVTMPDAGGEVVTGAPCTFDGQCAGAGADRCVAPERCIGFVCQPDPTWEFPCAASVDPCVAVDCVPATGACEQRSTCTCEPMVAPLFCGGPRSFSTADPGATAVVSGYGCGGGGAFGEHVLLFTAPATEGVKVTLDSGTIAGVYVLEGGAACDASACVAGGAPPFAFAAVEGQTYAVVVEHTGGAPTAVSLRLECGFLAEVDCDDGLDDDQNGLTDCADPLCAQVTSCVGSTVETQCEDEVDSDQDGQTDCEDSDCAEALACIQTCTFTPPAVSCGFQQGVNTGSGASTATDYPCGPSSPGPEIAYRFKPQAAGLVTATMSSPDAGARLYALPDQGFGCAPLTCEAWDEADAGGPAVVQFVAAAGQTWYLVVDGAVADQGVTYSLKVTCEP